MIEMMIQIINALLQRVYKFNWTSFQEISRTLQEGFQEKSRTCLHCFGLLCNVPNLLHSMEHVMMSSNERSSLCYSTDDNISWDQFLN